MRWARRKEAGTSFAGKNAGLRVLPGEELPEEDREGPFGFPGKNKIKTQPQRALWVPRCMGAAGQEDRFFSQGRLEFFHFLFDLPELGGHKRKTCDGFPASCLRGDLLRGTSEENAKAPV